MYVATMNKLGKRLREKRTEAGLSMAGLSSLSGVTAAHIGYIERGERPNPGWRPLTRIETALGLAHGALTRGLAA